MSELINSCLKCSNDTAYSCKTCKNHYCPECMPLDLCENCETKKLYPYKPIKDRYRPIFRRNKRDISW